MFCSLNVKSQILKTQKTVEKINIASLQYEGKNKRVVSFSPSYNGKVKYDMQVRIKISRHFILMLETQPPGMFNWKK